MMTIIIRLNQCLEIRNRASINFRYHSNTEDLRKSLDLGALECDLIKILKTAKQLCLQLGGLRRIKECLLIVN